MRRLLMCTAAVLASPALAAPPKPYVSVVSTSVDEGTAASVQISRTGNLSQSSTIIYSLGNATALAGINYVLKSGAVTFAKNQSAATIPLATLRDGVVTPNLYFIVRLGVVSNAIIQANGTVTVRNIDQPPPPPPVECPDGTTVPAGQTCPVPTPVQSWVLAPMVNDGYVRCKSTSGCHSIAFPCTVANCSYPNIIAQPGDVMQQAWNGCGIGDPCRVIGAYWPVGHDPRLTKLASDWYLGKEGWQEEWEGVAPAPNA